MTTQMDNNAEGFGPDWDDLARLHARDKGCTCVSPDDEPIADECPVHDPDSAGEDPDHYRDLLIDDELGVGR